MTVIQPIFVGPQKTGHNLDTLFVHIGGLIILLCQFAISIYVIMIYYNPEIYAWWHTKKNIFKNPYAKNAVAFLFRYMIPDDADLSKLLGKNSTESQNILNFIKDVNEMRFSCINEIPHYTWKSKTIPIQLNQKVSCEEFIRKLNKNKSIGLN